MNTSNHHQDVIIVGAGLSGICAAYYLQKECPNHSFTILEMRGAMGGTWDLFRYPGVRSDSDMYTLGYAFRPWQDAKAVTDGDTILQYIRDTAKDEKLEEKIHYHRKVMAASWSSAQAEWTVEVTNTQTQETLHYTCNFLFMCSGYYNYEQGYTPDFQGIEDYKGCLVHPQHWPQDLDYTGKRVLVIGSGATAVTLVPAMTDKAEEVIMLQRSPSYVVSKPAKDKFANFLKKTLPSKMAHRLVRRRNILMETFFYQLARRKPKFAKKMLIKNLRKELGQDFDVETHFTPSYNPWDQRVCLVPDSDLFVALKNGKARVITDHIHSFTEKGVQLQSGVELSADIIVTATGLEVKFLSDMKMTMDGKAIDPTQKYVYRGVMLSDIPNFVQVIGYTNISWTLKAGLACEYVCRLLNYMDKKGFNTCTPRATQHSLHSDEPLINLSSGYFTRARHKLPKQGSKDPWKLHQNYIRDVFKLRFGKLKDGVMEYK
ncbi:MAG TPA: FAD-containing monooxygenase EthA [Microscillaceae bacterium]|nr:FAD-containing monooxygenase EthA [Microscillaceae bacterium]